MALPDPAAVQLEHAWRYFELHAKQRTDVFNYFLVLSGAVAAGLATTLQGTPRFASLGIALGILLALVSFVFWKLDQRVSFLIKRAESALADVEQSLPARCAHLFLSEPNATKVAASAASYWTRHWTYGASFRIVFWVMGLFGIVGATLSGLKFSGMVIW